MNRYNGFVFCMIAAATLAAATVASADDKNMKMPPSASGASAAKMPMSDMPAHFKPTRSAYTTDRRFLVKLLSLPTPIPYEKYFSVRIGVYDGRLPHKQLSDARVEIAAGMRHGQKYGFAHGMESAPKLEVNDGVVTASGMYFHMMGPWVLQATVERKGTSSVADFELPCCGN